MLGLSSSSQTTINLRRNKQCVLNLASDSMGPSINALSRITGTEEISAGKKQRGYRFVKDKFGVSGLSAVESDLVRPLCISECLVQIETELVDVHEMFKDLPGSSGLAVALEVKVLRVHVDDSLKLDGYENRVDADKWRPMVMSFQDLYGVGTGKGDSFCTGKDHRGTLSRLI